MRNTANHWNLWKSISAALVDKFISSLSKDDLLINVQHSITELCINLRDFKISWLNMQITVFWDVMMCRPAERCQHLRGTCHHNQEIQAAGSSKTLIPLYQTIQYYIPQDSFICTTWFWNQRDFSSWYVCSKKTDLNIACYYVCPGTTPETIRGSVWGTGSH
jgi:hypothetical protein